MISGDLYAGHGGGGGGHGGGGGGAGGGGHASHSFKSGASAASLASLQSGRTTQYIWDMGAAYDTPLVAALQYRDAPNSDFVPCMCRAVSSCSREFEGEGLRACIYGVLVASNLVPSGAAGAVLDPHGGFKKGLEYTCFPSTIDLVPKRE